MKTIEAFRGAMLAECRAAACDRDLAAHFEGRNLGELASFCRHLATRHQHAVDSLRESGVGAGPEEPWLDDAARAFVLRVAGPRQLLEVALAAESETAEIYDRIAGEAAGDGRVTAMRLAERAHDAARQVSEAMEAAPSSPDWDELIAKGTVPALILGAERRLYRH